MNKGALQPLQGESPTGYWAFRGKPLLQDDVDRLKAKGVKFEPYPNGDLMPDNRLKHPRFRSDFRKNKKTYLSKFMGEVNENQEHRWKEYLALPEPRQDFFEWACQRDQRILYDTLEKLAKKPGGDRAETGKIKAIQTILEFGKVKPKTVLETNEKNAMLPKMTNEDLMKLVLEANGISWDSWLAFKSTLAAVEAIK